MFGLVRFMQRAVMSLVTAATVLWHAVFGCCTHHDHAAPDHDAVAQVAHESHDEDLDGDHDCEHHEAPGSAPVGPCDEAECSFLAAKLTSSAELVGEQLSAADVQEVRSVEARNVSAVADYLAPGDVRPPPLRIHLALGILLI